MNKKIFYFLYSILVTHYSVAQQQVFETDKAFLDPKYYGNESLALSNQQNDDLFLVLEGKSAIQGILLDKNHQEIKRIMAKSLPSKYQVILGYGVFEDVYIMLYCNSRETKFALLEFDLKQNKFQHHEMDFKLKKEDFIETVTYNNTLYLFTTTWRKPELNIYELKEDLSFDKTTINFPEIKSNPGVPYQLFGDFPPNNYASPNDKSTFIKIESRNPNVIETTSFSKKLYQREHTIIFSLDTQLKETKLYFLDLNTKKLTSKTFEQPAQKEEGYKKSNSYLFEDTLFQISSSNEKMKFRVSSVTTHTILKEFSIHKEDSIAFKNSPIIQEGGGMFPSFTENRVRKMEKTAKFLRKISSADIGISVYKVNGLYNIVLGGTKEIVVSNNFANTGFNGGFSTSTIAIPGGGSISINTGFNPVFYGYNEYRTSKSTYINCLFDQNFDHVQGDIPLNTYDFINEFEASLEKPEVINVFMHKDVLHFNYFDKKEEKFKLYQFEPF